MEIGDSVKKKSGKPFQNGEKIGVIKEFTTMTFPSTDKSIMKTVEGVFINGCTGKVRKDILMKVDLTQKWAECLGSSTSKIRVDMEKAKVYDTPEFWIAAKSIVEPEGAEEDYYEWMENDVHNWAGFIGTCCGDDFHTIAMHVRDNGY